MEKPKFTISGSELAGIPKGFCQCGCGLPTTITPKNDVSTNRVRGHPMRFIKGHNASLRKGQNHPSWKGGKTLKNGYVMVHSPDHPKSDRGGYMPEATLIVERAMGKYLPNGALPHHINGRRNDNRPQNLIVCQDNIYHGLLHQRQKALMACGHADWRQCGYCHKYDTPINLSINGSVARHPKCHNKYRQELRRIKKDAV